MKRKYVALQVFVLTMILVFNFVVPVAADSRGTGDYIYDGGTFIGESFVDENLVGTILEGENPNTRLIGMRSKKTQLPPVYKTLQVAPTGQPALGYTTSGAYVYFFEYGGTSKKSTFKVSTIGKIFSAEFSYETGKKAGNGSGYGAKVPAGATPGNPWKFYFVKNFKIIPTRVDIYANGVYLSSHIQSTSTYSLGHTWR